MQLPVRKLSALFAVVLLSPAVGATSAQAQSIEAAADGTGTLLMQSGHRLDITGGTLSNDGTNLFHSFTQFGLSAEQIANFLSNPNIQNILSRVTGGNASYINGLIQVTGGNSNLYLVNPAGIVFGAGARLDVPASFTATTATSIQVGNNWFNAIANNDYSTLIGTPSVFAFPCKDTCVNGSAGMPGAIVNAGQLAVGEGQTLTLLGGSVINTGSIEASGGQVLVAAVPGESTVRISLPGHVLSLEIQPAQTAQTPEVSALSLPELLTGGTDAQVTGLTVGNDGQVLLTSSGLEIPVEPGTVVVSGNINASNTATGQIGGSVNLLGTQVALVENAQLNVSGDAGGGSVLIGGDYQGTGEVPNAQETFVDRNVTINADALNSGNSGRVIVWADETTRFYGNISARGGTESGDGGFVEVSGKKNLTFDGQVDTGATAGDNGQLHLDPATVIIGSVGTDDAQLSDNQIFVGDGGNESFFISTAALITALNSGDVSISATNNIDINSDIISGSSNSLTFESQLINLSADIGLEGGDITFNGPVVLGSNSTVSTGTPGGNITFNNTLRAAAGNNYDLTLAAGTGTISFGAAVGNIATPNNTAFTFQVADVNPSGSSDPNFLTNVKGTLFFSAFEPTTGRELWKSDGTAVGTTLVKDINLFGDSDPRDLTNVNGTVFFSAFEPDSAREIWKSDGTAAGTVRVTDINFGAGDSDPQQLTNVNGTLFFSAVEPTTGRELWKSNGTTPGTQLVQDINPGAASSSPDFLTNVNGTLFFRAFEPTTGFELWKSGGIGTGATLVEDINAGIGSSSPQELTNVNGTLFFRAFEPTAGVELWKSDGTAPGTQLVQDINLGAGNSFPQQLTNVNGILFFSALEPTTGVELWRSDGTATGTQLVQDINPGINDSLPQQLTDVNGTLFFSAFEPGTGTELWQSDGTPVGTLLVEDINPGTDSSNPQQLTNINGTLFFSALEPDTGTELWQSDGTATGTKLVQDINPGTGNSEPQQLTNVNGTLFFSASEPTAGTEVRKIEGVLGDLAIASAGDVTAKDAINAQSITMTASNDITVSTLNTQGGPNNTGGTVEINAGRFFRATGTFTDQNGKLVSISSTGGNGGGAITIQHGGGSTGIPFGVGNSTTNGTSAAISSGAFTIEPTQSFSGNYSLGNIQIKTTITPPTDTPPTDTPPTDTPPHTRLQFDGIATDLQGETPASLTAQNQDTTAPLLCVDESLEEELEEEFEEIPNLRRCQEPERPTLTPEPQQP